MNLLLSYTIYRRSLRLNKDRQTSKTTAAIPKIQFSLFTLYIYAYFDQKPLRPFRPKRFLLKCTNLTCKNDNFLSSNEPPTTTPSALERLRSISCPQIPPNSLSFCASFPRWTLTYTCAVSETPRRRHEESDLC